MISGVSWRGDGGSAPALVYELPLPDNDDDDGDDGNRSAHTLDSRVRRLVEAAALYPLRADHP